MGLFLVGDNKVKEISRVGALWMTAGVFLISLAFPGSFLYSQSEKGIFENGEKSDGNGDELLFQDPKEYLDRLNTNRQTLLDEISKIERELDGVQKERQGAEREVKRLTLQIKNLKLQLQETELAIRELSLAIKLRAEEIVKKDEKIVDQKKILEELVRLVYENDSGNFIEVVLHKGSLSEFFDEIKYLESLYEELFGVINRIKKLRKDLEAERQILEEERKDQFRLKSIQENNAAALHQKEGQQKEVLRSKKNEETILKDRLAESKKALEGIQRSISLFVLKGTEVSTGEIIRYVLEASNRTGVRSAFILAVLEIESKLGANVGKGDWSRDMKENQKETFLQILQELGLKPDEAPVSKQVFRNGARVMWGGAMGPAQIIPTTWLLFKDEIAVLTGHNPPSPWSMEDAITGMTLYLKRYGAADRSQEAAAARAYVSGKPSCSSSVCRTYARQVMQKAEQWEEYLASLRE